MTRPKRQSSPKKRKAFRLGLFAEALCALWLRFCGYRVLARRFRAPAGEIDIVARKGNALAMIEVKARGETSAALEAIKHQQRRRIANAAQAFLQSNPHLANLDVRFDVMVVIPWRLPLHLPGAWMAE